MWSVIYKIYLPITKILYQNIHTNNLIFLMLDWFINAFKIVKFNEAESDSNISYLEWEKTLLHYGLFWSLVDYVLLSFSSKCYNLFSKTKQTGSVTTKISQLNNNNMYLFNNVVTVQSLAQTFLYGVRSVWKHLRLWILPILFILLFVYFSFFLKSLPFVKIFFGYILLGNMFYLLISGFVFFVKKYQYRLYTSIIQRFWRRTLIIFWVIEGTLFTCFIYLIFNANQEPIYVYDNIQIYKTHFYSWRYFLVKVFLSSLLIILTYILLLSLKWNTFTKTNNIALFITVILLYVSWIEFYQLFHLMNCYGNSNWIYDFSEHLWNLELEFKRTRIVNHYVTIGLIAKFWHIVFAVVFWIFFLLRGIESSRYRYPLLSANLQNFLIIYIMSWLYMYPWFKYTARKALDMPYFWFFVNNRKIGVFLFFNDIKLYFWGFMDRIYLGGTDIAFFKENSYFYWHESSLSIGNTQFRKHNIRDLFIRSVSVK